MRNVFITYIFCKNINNESSKTTSITTVWPTDVAILTVSNALKL